MVNIKEYVKKEKEYIINLRRWFHAHPEPSFKEINTCKKIVEELEKFGIPYQYISDTAIVATIHGKKGHGKTMVLRSDIDALTMDDLKEVPYASQNKGFCHACGHDAHAATLITAAKILKEKDAEFAGTILCFFQPAEELGLGARIFIKQGWLQNVDRIFGVHVASAIETGKVSLTPGPTNASCDYFSIEVTGKGAHVSTPELGIDALYIASQIVINLQSIVSRSSAPTDTIIVGVGVLKAGTQYNIIAENAILEGSTRTFSTSVRENVVERVHAIAKQTAAMYGATATVVFKDYNPPLVNDLLATQDAWEVATPIFGEANIIKNQEKMLGSDDFAEYLEEVPGVYAFVGSYHKDKINTDVSHHHGLFDIDEDALLHSCNLYVDYALSFLNK